MRRVIAFVGVACVAAGLVGGAAALWGNSALFLAHTWGAKLEAAPEGQVVELLDRLSGLGAPAFPTLAAALASSRECVAQGAARVLRGQATRLRTVAADEEGRQPRLLAKAVADCWPQYGPSARRVASEIVAALLASSPKGDHLGDTEFLATCSKILRSCPPVDAASPNEVAGPFAGRRSASNPAVAAAEREGSNSLQDPPPAPADSRDSPVVQASSLAERELPPKAAPMPRPAISSRATPAPAPLGTVEQTSRLSPSIKASDQERRRATTAQSRPEMPDGGGQAPGPGIANGARRLSSVQRVGFDRRGSQEGATDSALKSEGAMRQLARQLHDQDPQQVEAAREELKRCGLSDVEVELARQLTDADAGMRRALARALPATAGVDAAAWLLELARDPDADVRLEAITILATTGDPALLEPLRRLVQADPDERIQRLSDRLDGPDRLATRKSESQGRTRK